MAHKKGVGSSRNGRDSNSQRLGIKVYGGQTVTAAITNEATDELLVVSDDIEKNAATVGGQHDVSRFWLVVKFGLIAYAASTLVAVLCYS